jgi:hypothetical protein
VIAGTLPARRRTALTAWFTACRGHVHTRGSRETPVAQACDQGRQRAIPWRAIRRA